MAQDQGEQDQGDPQNHSGAVVPLSWAGHAEAFVYHGGDDDRYQGHDDGLDAQAFNLLGSGHDEGRPVCQLLLEVAPGEEEQQPFG